MAMWGLFGLQVLEAVVTTLAGVDSAVPPRHSQHATAATAVSQVSRRTGPT
jgi:hypothetical protein